jgi:hypothetical protein
MPFRASYQHLAGLYSGPFISLKPHGFGAGNPVYKKVNIHTVSENLPDLNPHGIRAHSGVFRELPDWQSGHFAGFSVQYSRTRKVTRRGFSG